MQLPASAISGLEAVINRYLRLDPAIGSRLAALSGRCIGIELRRLDLMLYVLPDEKGIHLKGHVEGEPDTVLRGTPLGMLRLGLGGNTEKPCFPGPWSSTVMSKPARPSRPYWMIWISTGKNSYQG